MQFLKTMRLIGLLSCFLSSLLVAHFALGQGGGTPSGNITQGCNGAPEAVSAAYEAEKAVISSAGAGAIASSTQCNSGYNKGSNTPCAVEKTAEDAKLAAQAGQTASSRAIQSGENAQQICIDTCKQSANYHAQQIKLLQSLPNASPDRIIEQQNFLKTAQENIKKCQEKFGFEIAGFHIQGWQLGLAAAAAGGVMLLTQSGKDKGGSSGGTALSSSGMTSSGVTPNVDGENSYDKGNPNGENSSPASPSLTSLNDMEQYWKANNCETLVYGNYTSSDNNSYLKSDSYTKCKEIAGNSTFTGTLLALGSCSDVSAQSKPECFDRLNNYCWQKDSQTRLNEQVCSGFCHQNAQADSCAAAVAENSNNNSTPTNNNGSGTSSYDDNNPFFLQTSSASTSASASTGFKATSKYSFNTQERGIASASVQKKQPPLDCSDAKIIFTPECETPMSQYCSQYGPKGKGCPLFCSKHKQICH